MALCLQPGMHAVVERLPDSRLRVQWRLVGWDDVSPLGAFDGTEREVLALLAQWSPEQRGDPERAPGHLR